MTTITTPHIDSKSDSDPFEQGLNADFYSSTAGQGIMSEGNGGMELANLDTDFKMQPEHVLEGQTGGGWAYGEVRKIDYCSDIFADETADATQAAHITVWQMAVRQYIPYQCSILFWDMLCFRSLFKYMKMVVTNDDYSSTTEFALATRMRVDGSVVTHTRTEHPNTAWTTDAWPPVATNKGNLKAIAEAVSAHWQHVFHMQEDVGAGWHECVLELYMQSTEGEASGSVPFIALGYADIEGTARTVDTNTHVHNRITFGPRAGNIFWML